MKNNISERVALLLQKHSYGQIVSELLQAVADKGGISSFQRKEILRHHWFAFKCRYIKDALDAVIDYAEILLEDDALTQEEWTSIRLLRIYLNIDEGDFLKYKKEARIKSLLSSQLKKLYADNQIERQEAIMQSEMQGLFGLSSTLYEKYVEEIMQEALDNGAKRVDLIKNV